LNRVVIVIDKERYTLNECQKYTKVFVGFNCSWFKEGIGLSLESAKRYFKFWWYIFEKIILYVYNFKLSVVDRIIQVCSVDLDI